MLANKWPRAFRVMRMPQPGIIWLDVDDFEEVGNRCDVVYTCHRCGAYEYPDGGRTAMFAVGSKTICEYCLVCHVERIRSIMDSMTARLVTMNTACLKEMPIEQVLELHPLLNPRDLSFVKVQKTKPIKAKPLSTIISDESVMTKVVLATLEGHQDLKAGSFVCWGVDNDVWQSSAKAIHAKYTPVSVDEHGWVLFEPKSDCPVDAALITYDADVGPFGGFSVENPSWGDQRVINGRSTYLHYGVVGDYVMRGMEEDDIYRIAKKFFENTYTNV